MERLRNRRTAVLLTIVVAVLATLVGVHRSVARASGDVEQLFYDGVYLESEGYTQQSINSQIEKMVSSALNMATLLQNNPALTNEVSAVIQARRLLYEAHSISDKSRVVADLKNAVSRLVAAASGMPEFSEPDWRTFEGASDFIDNTLAPAYNSKVDGFFQEQSFIAALIGRAAPEYY